MPQNTNPADSNYEQIVANSFEQKVSIRGSGSSSKIDPETIKKRAQNIIKAFDDGFQWSDIAYIIREALAATPSNLPLEQQKANIIAMIEHIVDITDTPFLPDRYSDPLFKAMIPPFIDLVLNAKQKHFVVDERLFDFSPLVFENYVKKLKDHFSDGFQWSDIAFCIKDSVQFVLGFSHLSTEEKKKSVNDALHYIIDETDMPMLPDLFVDPIFKALTPPLVDLVFTYVEPSS